MESLILFPNFQILQGVPLWVMLLLFPRQLLTPPTGWRPNTVRVIIGSFLLKDVAKTPNSPSWKRNSWWEGGGGNKYTAALFCLLVVTAETKYEAWRLYAGVSLGRASLGAWHI